MHTLRLTCNKIGYEHAINIRCEYHIHNILCNALQCISMHAARKLCAYKIPYPQTHLNWFNHSLFFSPFLSVCLSLSLYCRLHTQTHARTHSPSLSRTTTCTITHAHTRTHTHAHTFSLSLFLSLSLSFSLTHSLSHTHTLSLTLCLTHSLTLTHTWPSGLRTRLSLQLCSRYSDHESCREPICAYVTQWPHGLCKENTWDLCMYQLRYISCLYTYRLSSIWRINVNWDISHAYIRIYIYIYIMLMYVSIE